MRELSQDENKACNAYFVGCDIESGTAANDRKLFRAGFNAGLEYAQSKIDELEVALEQALKVTHHAIETTKAVVSDMSRISSKY